MLSKRNHYSFTFVELIIGIVILAILAAVGIGQYRKTVPKIKAGKAKHALALIAEAEKMYEMDQGFYPVIPATAVDATVGINATGMNLAAVDNDSDFQYSANAAGIISASNIVAIGTCPVGTPNFTYDLATGEINVPACYE